MYQNIARRSLLVGAAATGLTAMVPSTASATTRPATPRWSQLAFLNHSYAVLDRETADAIEASDYLRRFGVFEVRTTTNGQTTYTGRYLIGRQTYLEIFGPGDLPAPDDRRGTTGLALSPDRAGRIEEVKSRMVALGVAEPLDVVQTKEIDGDQVPWFRVVAPAVTYAASFPWVMEYLESYFADPRVEAEPASFLGDVSRERYLPDGYEDKLFRDVERVELDVPESDVAAVLVDLRASGLAVCRERGAWVATGRSEQVVVRGTSRASAGWRRLDLTLGRHVRTQHVERIGRSLLTVGPGRRASWTFERPR